MNIIIISQSDLINELVKLETTPNNNYTIRKQFYPLNKYLLEKNPVASSSVDSDNYVRAQYELFNELSKDNTQRKITISKKIIKGDEIVFFLIQLVCSVYFNILLGIDTAKIKRSHK